MSREVIGHIMMALTTMVCIVVMVYGHNTRD